MTLSNELIGITRFISCLICLFLSGYVLAGSSLERESLIAERLTERVQDSEAHWIKSGKGQFFSLLTEQSQLAESKNAAIIIHGMGAHPDWPGVISHVRKTLPAQGWTTLSIQMPVLLADDPIENYGKTSKEAGQRIKAAVNFLRKEKEYENVVIIAYSFGATVAAQYLAKENSGVMGMVGVSMISQPFLNPRLSLLRELAKLNIPILDVYGSIDRNSVIEEAPDRRLAARKGENRFYKQLQIDGADNSYSGVEEVLVKRIRGWMDKLVVEMGLIEEQKN